MSKFKDNGKSNILSNNYFVNKDIKESKMLVINENGENLGILSKEDALKVAQGAELDLVQVGEKDSTIIAKVMDFGKFLYIKKKQLSESKKKQKIIHLKEIKIRPNIGDQDYNTKLNKAISFFKEGKKVKFTLQFRGREFIMINDLGKKFFERIKTDLDSKDLGVIVEEKEQRSGPFWSKIYFLK